MESRLPSGSITGCSVNMSGGQKPPDFHNSISNWGSNSLNISILTPEGINIKMSSFIEILDNVFQYHKLFMCMYIKRDWSDYTFFYSMLIVDAYYSSIKHTVLWDDEKYRKNGPCINQL